MRAPSMWSDVVTRLLAGERVTVPLDRHTSNEVREGIATHLMSRTRHVSTRHRLHIRRVRPLGTSADVWLDERPR